MVTESHEQWNRIVGSIKFNDIYYTYEYCSTIAKLEKGKAKLFYYENHMGIVIYPVIVREINSKYKKTIYDMITPYGYGGPLVNGIKEVLKKFRTEFILYCKKNNIISEVINFHPLYNNASSMGNYCNLYLKGETTAVNLTNELNMIRSQYTSMNKRNILKAHKNGLKCEEVTKSADNINVFLGLYNETMNRNNASDFYYFSYDIIDELLIDTGTSNSHLLFVYYGEIVISAVLLFTTANFSHYHLGASRTEYLYLRPNNLIFDYMVEFSKNKDCTYLHLGGGYEENDNLFKYKTSFTNNNNYEYYIGTNILDVDVYDFVVEEKRLDHILNENYFPLYRGTDLKRNGILTVKLQN
ncbi:GNAT family N-acetyltransferase [Sporosarcina sp. FA9]|uniref:GNAT family N-acetyltransferase n=1 Tax=Sporosarcina sp. FA9 TaxID=3413030 RepID=UPI003F654DEE